MDKPSLASLHDVNERVTNLEKRVTDKTLTPVEEALTEKLVYVLSILEGMSKRVKTLEDKTSNMNVSFAGKISRLMDRVEVLENSLKDDGK